MKSNKKDKKVLQNRNFLLLRNDETAIIVKNILKSPLGLAKDLIIRLNENRYEELKNNLDIIKQFVAGVNRANSFGDNYQLAKFYPNMFSFHQFLIVL